MIHYCEPNSDGGVCFVNNIPEDLAAECGDPSTWCCHDWATCFAVNCANAAWIARAYTAGYDDSAFGWPRGHHLAAVGLLK